jgi:hypothetical protein
MYNEFIPFINKIKINLKNFILPQDDLNEKEKFIIEIIESLLLNKDTNCSFSYLSGTYLIINQSLNINIRIDYYNINISGGEIIFSTNTSIKFNQIVFNLLNKNIEDNKLEIENKFFENEIESLKNINNKLIIE